MSSESTLTRRSVSPSIVAAERRDRAQAELDAKPKPKHNHSFKRAAEEAMTALDDLASSGDVSENGYLNLAKHLKTVHDSNEKRSTRIAEDVVLEMAAQAPHTLIWTPRAVNTFHPDFLRKLLLARSDVHKNCKCGNHQTGCGRDDDFLQELVEFFLGPEDSEMDNDCIRNGIFLLLDTDSKRLGPTVLFHLTNAHKNHSPNDIFEDDREADMEHALQLNPNRDFFAWLVRDLDPKEDEEERDELECLLECLEEESDLSGQEEEE